MTSLTEGGMSNSILASSLAVDYSIKCALHENGWHISALSQIVAEIVAG